MTKRDAKKAAKLYGAGGTLGSVADALDATRAEVREALVDQSVTIRRGRPRKS